MELPLKDDTRARARAALPCLGAVLVVAVCALRTTATAGADTLASVVASDDTTSFAVRPGALRLDVGARQFAQTPTAGGTQMRVPFTITDARGTGAGWSVGASFASSDTRARVEFATLRDAETGTGVSSADRLLAGPLTGVLRPILAVASGQGGMGRFGGALELSLVPAGSRTVSGQLTLVLSSAP